MHYEKLFRKIMPEPDGNSKVAGLSTNHFYRCRHIARKFNYIV